MPGRGRSSFNKRQKERSRQEKQREKAERKSQRKLEKPAGSGPEFGSNEVFFEGLEDVEDEKDSEQEA